MNFFCSQYLYLSMLALWSGLHHCNQIWMPHHICFKHCTKVYSEAFASKRAHPFSELSKTCMSLAQSSRDWEELSCGLESLWTQAGPAHVFVQKEGACASPKHLEPDASSESNREGQLPQVMLTCYQEVSAVPNLGSIQPKHCLWTGLHVNNF